MSTYWKADNVVRIGATQVKISSENGLSYNPSQKIQLFVPPSIKFLSGKDSYLEFDLRLSMNGGDPTKLQLDPNGAGTLFKNLRIYDGTRGNLIEELNEYSSLVSLRYDYDADDSLRATRSMMEGGTTHVTSNKGTHGSSKSRASDTLTNPYFNDLGGGDQTSAWTDADFMTVKCCVPIHAGVFTDKIFPVMMTSGLYLEWDLEPAARVIKQLDSVMNGRRPNLNPYFHSVNGSTGPDEWTNGGGNTAVFYIKRDNSNIQPNQFPFCVGEEIGIWDLTPATPVEIAMNDPARMIILEINASATAAGGDGLIEIKINNGVLGTRPSGGTGVDQNCVLYSKTVADAASYPATYTVSNFNLVATSVSLDPAYEKGMLQKAREGRAIEFDIYSSTCYKHSILASDTQATWNIFANNSRAKSLIISPTDSTVYTSSQLISGTGTYEITSDNMDVALNSAKSGMSGICDGLSSVQFMLDGKLVPSRPIDTTKLATRKSISAFHLFELEKGLENAGIEPRSFSCFLENFVISRGFAVNQGAMDLRNKDLSVILKYEVLGGPTRKPKLYNSFICHVRRLIIRNGAVSVQF